MDEYRDIFLNLIQHVRGDAPFILSSDVSARVEFTMFKDGKDWLIHAVSMCDEAISPQIPEFTITVKTDEKPKSVKLLPHDNEVSFEFNNGFTIFKARALKIFDTYQIQF